MRLQGKRALITGATSGIGLATARRFAAEGAAVAVAGRNHAAIDAAVGSITEAGGTAVGIICDVLYPESCRAAVVATADGLGGLDILFNNAGVIHRERTVPETTLEEWDDTMNVNARGTFLMSQAALPLLNAGNGSVIVNNASYVGLVGIRGAAAYAAAKGAVVQLTRAMALDHAADGVRVNAVAAGSVDTPMLQGEMEEMGGVEQVRHLFEEKHPLGRIARPEEIADAVVFLASDEAAFITGAILSIDGGITAG